MRSLILASLILLAPASMKAQRLDLNSIDQLEARASESTILDLDGEMMAFASEFLSDDDDLEEIAARGLIDGLDSIHVRVLEFDEPEAYTEADLQAVRDQLTGEGWRRIVLVREDDEDVGIWTYNQGEEMSGMVILVVEDDEIVVVNFVGSIQPEDLNTLGRQFGGP